MNSNHQVWFLGVVLLLVSTISNASIVQVNRLEINTVTINLSILGISPPENITTFFPPEIWNMEYG